MEFSLQAMPLPLRFRPETPMTDDELLRFCAVNEGLQVEREKTGEILIMTPAGNTTSRKNAYIIQALANWSDSDGRGAAFDSNAGFNLSDGSMRSPDAAWIESSRLAAIPLADQDRFASICPNFIVELRSPSDRLSDLQAKMQHWITNGTQLAWLIDPQSRTVTVYQPGQLPDTHDNPNLIEGTGPVAGFKLNLAKIWE